MFLDHTQRRSTVGRTPLDEWSARRRDLYLTTHDTHRLCCVVVCDLETSRMGAPYIYDISHLRVKKHWNNNNSTTRLYLVGSFYEITLGCTDPWTSSVRFLQFRQFRNRNTRTPSLSETKGPFHSPAQVAYQIFFAPLSTSPVTLEMRTERREGIWRQVSIVCRLV